MSTKNTGGPAFPRPIGHARLHNGENTAQDGMTLRDYFAAHASEADIRYWQVDANGNEMRSRSQARWVYADSMLKTREQ
jgi:hypothetical protein